jgi:hypothetical protein
VRDTKLPPRGNVKQELRPRTCSHISTPPKQRRPLLCDRGSGDTRMAVPKRHQAHAPVTYRDNTLTEKGAHSRTGSRVRNTTRGGGREGDMESMKCSDNV